MVHGMDLPGKKGPQNGNMVAEKGPSWMPTCKRLAKKVHGMDLLARKGL